MKFKISILLFFRFCLCVFKSLSALSHEQFLKSFLVYHRYERSIIHQTLSPVPAFPSIFESSIFSLSGCHRYYIVSAWSSPTSHTIALTDL